MEAFQKENYYKFILSKKQSILKIISYEKINFYSLHFGFNGF